MLKLCNLSAAEKRKRDGNSGRQIERNNKKEKTEKEHWNRKTKRNVQRKILNREAEIERKLGRRRK